MEWEVAPSPVTRGIEDIQAQPDGRRLAINAVGIRRLRLPIQVEDSGTLQHTVAEVGCAVALAAEHRGTHMSRFVALLAEAQQPLSAGSLPDLLTAITGRLDAHTAEIEYAFPFFIHKRAPVSGAISPMDYRVRLHARLAGDKLRTTTEVTVPVTSLCPCSKEISAYGAHNQRSHVRLAIMDATCGISELVELVESEASAPLYGLLKREDEKQVTEQAYENPKFVEDMVRDVALRVKALPGVNSFRIEVENFESIHNHSAYAIIEQGE